MISLHAWLVVAALGAPGDVEVVKFTASWCQPCQAMEPILDQLTHRGVPVRRVDVDQRRDLADRYAIKSLPTLLIVSGGQVVDRVEGTLPLESLLARLAPHTSSAGSPAAASPASPPSAIASVATPPTSSDAMEQLARQATVRLRVEDATGHSFGTGTIVDVHGPDALVLTCGHIFRESQGKGGIVIDLYAPGADGPISGELIRYDLQRDLALVGIRTTAKITPVPVAGPDRTFSPGQRLFSVGCSHGEDPSVLRGHLKAVNKYLGPDNFTVEGRPEEGRSGGGLFSYDGLLVGVCNAADPEIEEGLYAAFGSIHHHLDDAQLSFVYRQSPAGAPQLATRHAPLATAAAVTYADTASYGEQPASEPQSLSDPSLAEQFARATITDERAGTEVICIIRSHNDPVSPSQIVVLDRPSRDFLSQLSEERRAHADRQMTQLRVQPSASAGPTVDASRTNSTRRLQRPPR
jgi:hypothetical protein